jgi:hypothetical protein
MPIHRTVLFGALALLVSTSVASAQALNAERYDGGNGGGGGGGLVLPNLDAMSPEMREDYLRKVLPLMGVSPADVEMILSYGDRAPAFNKPLGSNPFPIDDGEDGAYWGCQANANFFPEHGGCLENDLNKQAYDRARDLGGQGVELPPSVDLDELLPEGYTPPGEEKSDVSLYDDLMPEGEPEYYEEEIDYEDQSGEQVEIFHEGASGFDHSDY